MHTETRKYMRYHEILWYWYTNREYDMPALPQMYSKLIPCIIDTPVWFPHLVSTDFLMIGRRGTSQFETPPGGDWNAKRKTTHRDQSTGDTLENGVFIHITSWLNDVAKNIKRISSSKRSLHGMFIIWVKMPWQGPGVAKRAQSVDG